VAVRSTTPWDNFPYLDDLRERLNNDEISGEDFAQVLGTEWRMDDNPSRHTAKWLELFRFAHGALGHPLVDSSGEPLPEGDVLEAWRGVSVVAGGRGMSWTLSRDRAIWFANRWLVDGESPHLFRTEVQRENVLAFFVSREEVEVIVDPATLGPLTEEAI
jgi:hypothetical protein